jgi:hypothetical protein
LLKMLEGNDGDDQDQKQDDRRPRWPPANRGWRRTSAHSMFVPIISVSDPPKSVGDHELAHHGGNEDKETTCDYALFGRAGP